MSELVRGTQIRIGVADGRQLVIDAGGAPDDVFGVMADEYRRQVLAVIRETSTAMDLSTLVERVTDRLESEHSEPGSDVATNRLRISLHHHHLPKMASAGFLEYDSENHLVEATDVIKA